MLGTNVATSYTCVLPPQTLAALEHLLAEHEVSVAAWGTGEAKTVEDLLVEVKSGESRLLTDADGFLWRNVSVVGVDVFFIDPRQGMLHLFEAEQRFRSGRRRARQLRTSIAEKQLPGESPPTAARRAIEEELGLSTAGLMLIEKGSEVIEEDSSSFPGLHSRRSLTYFECALSSRLFDPDGYEEHQADKTTSFAWRRSKACLRPSAKVAVGA